MKKLIFFAALVCSMLAVQTVMAQSPVATLEHNGTSQVFYGQSSLEDAYTASVNGDQIYLSAGFFTAPASIAKGVKITGSGHFPIEGKQTQITTGVYEVLYINAGADSLRLEGLYINGAIKYDANNSINFVKIIRCGFSSALFQSISAAASKNYCSFEECFISGIILFAHFGNNFLLRNSIVKGFLGYVDGNALIDGNIFLINDQADIYKSTFQMVLNSTIQNNICLATKNLFFNIMGDTKSNTINKNLFASSDPKDVNKATNYTGIAQADIFVNQAGNLISYSQDYHLMNPGTYIGTDGTPVGLYGGQLFKENGVPSNPNVVSKTIAPSTDTDGNLQINIKVEAQDH